MIVEFADLLRARVLLDRVAGADGVTAAARTLLRLEDKRLVATRLGEPTPQRGGRRKKYYRPLAAGRRELAASLEALRSMTRGLNPGFEVP